MITVEHLVKRYGSKTAVDDLSFSVDKGEIVGFLGPNGAGKSTTLRILAGFIGMTAGKVEVAGFDIRETARAREKLGYMPEAVPLYPEMRVVEYLTFRAELKRVPRGQRRAYVEDAMAKACVDDVANAAIGHLSKGYRQRVGLADALVARPPLLILDEPTAGLDPNQIREVRDVIRELGKEHTVLLSTHILGEVEAVCTRVVVIARGKLVAEGTLAELARMRRPAGLRCVVRGERDVALEVLRAVPGIRSVTGEGEDAGAHVVRCAFAKKLDEGGILHAIEDAVAKLVGAGCSVREATPIRNSLEEVFAELTVGAPPRGAREREPEPNQETEDAG